MAKLLPFSVTVAAFWGKVHGKTQQLAIQVKAKGMAGKHQATHPPIRLHPGLKRRASLIQFQGSYFWLALKGNHMKQDHFGQGLLSRQTPTDGPIHPHSAGADHCFW